MLIQSQKHQQQIQSAQAQRLLTIQQQTEDFLTTMKELESSVSEEYRENISNSLRKEMSALQKKILVDLQTQEVNQMKRNLQNFMF